MYPYLKIYGVTIASTFGLCVGIGVLAMILFVYFLCRKKLMKDRQIVYVLCVLVVAFVFALIGAVLFQSLFDFFETGEFVLRGMTFYGGLIAGGIMFFALIGLSGKKFDVTAKESVDVVLIPMVVFHFFGRIGCFLGGCCYGAQTESILGIYFPDIPESGIYHNGAKCYPTQLYEALGLLVMVILLASVLKKHKLLAYMIMYPMMRIALEFLRGDNRGKFFNGVLSPAQYISVFLLSAVATYLIYQISKKYFYSRIKQRRNEKENKIEGSKQK